MNRTARLFRKEDAEEVSMLIIRTLRAVNIRGYTPEYIEETVALMRPENIIQRASWTHF